MARVRNARERLDSLPWGLRQAAAAVIRDAISAGQSGPGVISRAVGAIYQVAQERGRTDQLTRQLAYQTASLEYASQQASFGLTQALQGFGSVSPPVPTTIGADPGYATSFEFQGRLRPGEAPQTIYHVVRTDGPATAAEVREAAAAELARIQLLYGDTVDLLPGDAEIIVTRVERG